MPLSAGTRLGPYEILEPLGAGGMGEVYRARDTKLGRHVAVKVLPEDFAHSEDRLARFEREARVLASLNHPHIATLHGFEQEAETRFLVMEVVEGEDLATRLKRGPLLLREVLPLFVQVAKGLEAAHEKGVIHRDLKPANIKVTEKGTVKILDFGLAKAMPPATTDRDLSQSPTRSATHRREIVGTAGFMSPEQARGQPVDRRTDIWSFGCVLYEALSGRRAFGGETVSDMLAAVLDREVDWTALPKDTPAALRSLLRRCLQKDRDRRLHDIADARIEIEETLVEPSDASSAAVPLRALRRERRRTAYVAGGSLFLGTLMAATGIWTVKRSTEPTRQVVRFRMGVQPAEQLGGALPLARGHLGLERPSRTDLALSPDGRYLVFSGGSAGTWQLYVRPLSEPEASPVPGTEGAASPFFSPDGQWVGFWAGPKLKKVQLAGGLPVTICETDLAFGASWGSDDTIVFAQERGGLLQVSADGGTPEELTTLEEGEYAHRLPHFLPGGEVVLFTVQRRFMSLRDARIVSQSLTSGERRVLVEPGADARYVPTGHLLYARWGTLMAAPFNAARLQVTGGSVPVIDSVMQAVKGLDANRYTGAAQFSISRNGTLVYLAGGVPEYKHELVWVDRNGRVEPLGTPTGTYAYPRLSPDGQRLAITALEMDEKTDFRIWVYDISRGTFHPLTHGGMEGAAAWAPDGRRIAFGAANGQRSVLFWQLADGSGEPERLTSSKRMRIQLPCSWSPDGRELAFTGWDEDTDILVLPLPEGERRPRPLVQGPFWETDPAFSPDGRWLAFGSWESGRLEVYVQPYPGPGSKTQISVEGGTAPTWSRNGRELFFHAPGERGISQADSSAEQWRMMVVDIATGPVLRVGRPRMLFEGRYYEPPCCPGYDVTPDGQRFLMVALGELPPHAPVTHINVVLNWSEELKQLVPTD